MKKRFIPLALALALLLTGCGLADQWNTVREEYIEPAIERADGAGTEPEDAVAAPNIGTDRELLTDYERFEAVYSRTGAVRRFSTALLRSAGGATAIVKRLSGSVQLLVICTEYLS